MGLLNISVYLFIPALILLNFALAPAMTPNPILSRGKPAYTSLGRAPELTDGKFVTPAFTIRSGSWVAIRVRPGPSRIFFSWNDPAYTWSDSLAKNGSCKGGIAIPIDYDMMTSANSVDGCDGRWDTALRVRGNPVSARGHLIDFSGKCWVKMRIISGAGSLDEIEVFDASNGMRDSWFFCGTSISANAYKGTPPAQNFADLVTAANPGYAPAMVRGGIGCIKCPAVAEDIHKFLAMTRGLHYWAIEMGTNDAWYGTDSNLAKFVMALQTVIDSCKAAGIEPVVARIMATDSARAKWQVSPAFLAAVDSLVAANNLIPGPDLHAWFRAHPSSLNGDGVHPNARGAAEIQNLWAQKMAWLYRQPGR